jgi:hypothetical protein
MPKAGGRGDDSTARQNPGTRLFLLLAMFSVERKIAKHEHAQQKK